MVVNSMFFWLFFIEIFARISGVTGVTAEYFLKFVFNSDLDLKHKENDFIILKMGSIFYLQILKIYFKLSFEKKKFKFKNRKNLIEKFKNLTKYFKYFK